MFETKLPFQLLGSRQSFLDFVFWSFVIVSSFGIRISNFYNIDIPLRSAF